MPLDIVVVRPFQDRPAGELGPVADNTGGLSIDPDQCIQLPRNPGTRDAGIRHQAQVLAAAIIVHRQDAEPMRGPEGIGQKVQRPAFARPKRLWHRCPRATGPFPASSSPDAQLLVGVKPIELLVVHDHPFAFQHHPDPPVAEPAALGRDGFHLLAYLRVIRRAFTLDRLWIDTDKSASPALRDVMIPHRPERCLSPLNRCRQFFPSRSFRTALSSIVSASRRLSRAFSSSIALSFATSETSMPPFFDLYL